MRKKVVLIGTGLIGGSLALAIKKEHDVMITGYDIFKKQVERAKELHVVDEIA
ncbi:prephenate dehydrogenase, partial [Bacillus thuringiensis]|nr:prephenate dehydrogenase [Bacillus thuringiensis]